MPLDPDASERSPSEAEVIRRALIAFGMELHVSFPAVVTQFDGKNKVSVKPLVKNAYLDENDARQVESLPVITGVPVQFPGAGVFRLSFPISDGTVVVGGVQVPATTGLVVCTDRSIDKWLSGNGQEVDPQIDHEHAIFDGVFLPGVSAFGVALSAPTDGICLGDLNGNDFVALAQKVLNELNAIKSAFQTAQAHTHPYLNGTNPANTSPSTGMPSYSPNSVAASQVKAK